MIIKNLSDGNLLQVAKFCRINLELDVLPDFLFKEKTIDDYEYDPSLNLIAFSDDEQKILGFISAVIRRRKDGNVGYIKLICVDTNERRKGVAGKLLSIVEEKMKAECIQVLRLFESYPNYLTPGLDPFYTEAICFFERNGFKKFNDTSNLLCDLASQSFDTTTEEEKLSSINIEIKRAELNEKQKVLDFINRVFPAWEYEVNAAYTNNPISLHIAKLENGEVFAFSAYECNNKGTGWFGPMGTDPVHRIKKVGSILLKRCLNDMKSMGFAKSIIPWVGPIPFYMNYCNSRVQRVFWRYEKILS